MVDIIALCSLGMSTASLCLAVVSVRVSWRAVSACTASRKWLEEQPIQISDARYAALKAEMEELYSTLEKFTTAQRRIDGRLAKRESRERSSQPGGSNEPPPGTSKAELLRHYGLSGKVGGDFHRAAQEIDRRNGSSE